MIENTSPIVGSLFRLNDSTVIVQAQDPWMTFSIQVFAVIIGGIIALMANYVLQKKRFSVEYELQRERFRAENETNQKNRRDEAYIELLGAIFRYESTHKLDDDLQFHAIKAYIYGSTTVSTEINNWFGKLLNDDTAGFLPSADLVRIIIMTEIGLDQMIENKRWKTKEK